jgi:CRP/FNR family transcriptional regulator
VRRPAGAALFNAGEPSTGVWVLTRGLVAIRRTTIEGESVIVRLVFPVRSFGPTSFLRASAYMSTAVAVSEVTACLIRRSTVDELLAREPALGLGLLRRLAADLASAEEALLTLATVPARDRLLRLLLQLLEYQPGRRVDPDQASTRLELPLSRKEMAQALAVRPETLSRAIAEAEAQGLVRMEGRLVTIPDVGRVLDAVGPAA